MAILRYDEIMQTAIANMVARQNKITDFNEGSIIHTILDTVSRLGERAYVAIRQEYNQLLALLPYSLFEMSRREGTNATGKVIFSRGSALGASTLIPKGTKVSGGSLSYVTTEAGAIPAGALSSAPVSVVAERPGILYNITADTISSIDSVVPADVVDVSNPEAFYGGSDDESDSEFEQRFKDRLNGLSGTSFYAVKSAAMSVGAVKSLSIEQHTPLLKDIYAATIYLDDGSGGASQDTIDAVKLAITGDGSAENPGHLAPGINVRVMGCTAVPVTVTATVRISAEDASAAKEELTEVIRSYIYGLGAGQSVLLSNLVSEIMAVEYTQDVTISSPSANITISANQVATPGTITVNIEEVE